MKTLRKIAVIFIMTLVISGCGNSGNYVTMPFSHYTAIGKNYKEIVTELKNMGFTALEEEITPTTDKSRDGEILYLSIGNNNHFLEGDALMTGEKVKIIYYKYEAPEETIENVPNDAVNDTSDENKVAASFKEANTEEEFLDMVKEAADLNIGEKDKLNDVSLDDGILRISVSLDTDNDFGFTKEEFAEDRASSITDGILDIDDKWWNELVLEFEGIGTVTKGKTDIVTNEYGMRYYETTYLDGSKHEDPDMIKSSEDTKAFVEKYTLEFIAAAKLSLDKYIDNYKMSLASQKWQIVKYDETDTMMGMTELSYKDVKYTYVFVGTLNMKADGEVESTSPHLIMVGDSVLYDDGYCDELLESFGG